MKNELPNSCKPHVITKDHTCKIFPEYNKSNMILTALGYKEKFAAFVNM